MRESSTVSRIAMPAGVALFALPRLLASLAEPRLPARDIHRVAGEPARIGSLARPDRVRLVTWNIDRGRAFDTILQILTRLDADIIVLQEVDRFCRRSGRRDVPKELADALEMNWLCAGEFQELGEGARQQAALTGQAVLSRFPLEEPQAVAFTHQARLRWRLSPLQPRRGGRVALRVKTGGLLLYNVHLESWAGERLRCAQLAELLDDQARLDDGRTPVVIAGDFNNLPPARSCLFGRLAAARFTDVLAAGATDAPTSIRHAHPLDWIFAKRLVAARGEVGQAEGSSDHHPLVATLTLAR